MAGYHLPNNAQISQIGFWEFANSDSSLYSQHFPTSNLAHCWRPSHVSSGFFGFACVSSMTSPCTPRQVCLLCSLKSHYTLYIVPLGPILYYTIVTVHLLLSNCELLEERNYILVSSMTEVDLRLNFLRSLDVFLFPL